MKIFIHSSQRVGVDWRAVLKVRFVFFTPTQQRWVPVDVARIGYLFRWKAIHEIASQHWAAVSSRLTDDENTRTEACGWEAMCVFQRYEHNNSRGGSGAGMELTFDRFVEKTRLYPSWAIRRKKRMFYWSSDVTTERYGRVDVYCRSETVVISRKYARLGNRGRNKILGQTVKPWTKRLSSHPNTSLPNVDRFMTHGERVFELFFKFK